MANIFENFKVIFPGLFSRSLLTCDPDDLEHAIPVVGLAELVVVLLAPRVGARSPTLQKNKEIRQLLQIK